MKIKRFALAVLVLLFASCSQKGPFGDGDKITISASNKYTSADGFLGGQLIANRNTPGSWEEFKLEKQENDYWRLMADNGFYVRVNETTNILVADGPGSNKEELFKIQLIDSTKTVSIFDFEGNPITVLADSFMASTKSENL